MRKGLGGGDVGSSGVCSVRFWWRRECCAGASARGSLPLTNWLTLRGGDRASENFFLVSLSVSDEVDLKVTFVRAILLPGTRT